MSEAQAIIVVALCIGLPVFIMARLFAWKQRDQWPTRTWVDYVGPALDFFGITVGVVAVALVVWAVLTY